jgi:hypothetical protein
MRINLSGTAMPIALGVNLSNPNPRKPKWLPVGKEKS